MQILALKCNNNNNVVVDDYDHSYVSNIYIYVYMYISIYIYTTYIIQIHGIFRKYIYMCIFRIVMYNLVYIAFVCICINCL